MNRINVLVIGQGGREHALVRAMRLSSMVANVHAVPGSAGMTGEATCHSALGVSGSEPDVSALLDLIKREQIELVVIGPEGPLAEGVSDRLRAEGIAVVGPGRAAAQLEASKVLSKDFMREAGVKTAGSTVVKSVADIQAALQTRASQFKAPFVLKADGLAAGKGVFICKDERELLEAARFLFDEQGLASAGDQALLEEFQSGYEISYLVLTNGEEFEPLILAQDHKRLADGDVGPNTGGMGVVAPLTIDSGLRARIDADIVAPTIASLKRKGFVYRGILYFGLMITADGPSLLEYNVRFGDPEAQALLPLLDGDWAQVFLQLADGRLTKLKWKSSASACLVLAAEGYPDAPVKGAVISGLGAAANAGAAYALHAGTRLSARGEWETSGGRVVNVIGLGRDIREALTNAYEKAATIKWFGRQMRKDIGEKQITKPSAG